MSDESIMIMERKGVGEVTVKERSIRAKEHAENINMGGQKDLLWR